MFQHRIAYRQIKNSGFFDPVYYLFHYADVRRAGLDPLRHFVSHGWKEGRNPSPWFDTQFYLDSNPDVKQAGINPLLHYLRHGRQERRAGIPAGDPAAEPGAPDLEQRNLDDLEADLKTVDALLDVTLAAHTPQPIAARPASGPRMKVSICVPVYNGARYLRACLDSILAQTFTDFELLVVNDASRDGSAEIIRSYIDPRLRYFENETNLGLVGNWNRCLELARGDYIYIFHQDDVMTPGNLAKKAAILDAHAQVGLVYSDCQVIDPQGEIQLDHWLVVRSPNLDTREAGRSFFDLMFTNVNLVCCPTVMLRRECYERLGGYDARLPFSVDMEMWLRTALFYDVAYLAEPLIQYRIHTSNQTQRHISLEMMHLYLCKRIILQKFPDRLDASYWNTLVEYSSKSLLDRALYAINTQQYRLARLHLLFLEKILSPGEPYGSVEEYIRRQAASPEEGEALVWFFHTIARPGRGQETAPRE